MQVREKRKIIGGERMSRKHLSLAGLVVAAVLIASSVAGYADAR